MIQVSQVKKIVTISHAYLASKPESILIERSKSARILFILFSSISIMYSLCVLPFFDHKDMIFFLFKCTISKKVLPRALFSLKSIQESKGEDHFNGIIRINTRPDLRLDFRYDQCGACHQLDRPHLHYLNEKQLSL